MYKITQRREKKARPILEKAYESLVTRGRFDVHALERELRQCWNVGYHELYEILEDAFKDEKWFPVAVYYMERISSPHPTCELRCALSRAYGLKKLVSCDKSEFAREAFWKNRGIVCR